MIILMQKELLQGEQHCLNSFSSVIMHTSHTHLWRPLRLKKGTGQEGGFLDFLSKIFYYRLLVEALWLSVMRAEEEEGAL